MPQLLEVTPESSNAISTALSKIDYSVLTDNYVLIIGAAAAGIFGFIALKKAWGAMVGMFKRA